MKKEILDTWPKQITVDKRIVGILSTSTYQNFPRALKEIITNSYDADATTVKITIDVEDELIVIEDNGKGMDSIDFGFYLRIAAQRRQKNDNSTKLGRRIIGQFGVGFLSVFPFFKSYSIESTKSGSVNVLYADIPLAMYFDQVTSSLDVGSITINGGEIANFNEKSNSYTRIKLKGFNELTRSFFKDSKDKKVKGEVSTYEGISKLKWILSDDLPLRFREQKFNDIFSYPEYPPFNVIVNDETLYRGVYGDEILDTHSGEYTQIGNIKFKYFIATPGHAVSPIAGRFIKIRNLNVGVGEDRTDFSELRGGNRAKLNWLTGEVHILEGMNDLIKVSREGFNYSEDYELLKDFFNEKLNQLSTRLENQADLKKAMRQTGESFKVQNVALLNPEVLVKKIKKFEEEGYNVRHSSKNKSVVINDEEREIVISDNITDFEKHIIIENVKYLVKSDNWDYERDFFPACRLINNQIIVNSKYPLFKGIKYTDVFVKMHLMLLFNYEKNFISSDTYSKLTKDILTFYSDYLK